MEFIQSNLVGVISLIQDKINSLKPYQLELYKKNAQQECDKLRNSIGTRTWSEETFQKEFERINNYVNFQIYIWEKGIKDKLQISLMQYINENDTINNPVIQLSPKGFSIIMKVIRDGIEYDFSTECIDAGGYNVQCYHLRYITKTKLVKNDNKQVIKNTKWLIDRYNEILEYKFRINMTKNTKYVKRVGYTYEIFLDDIQSQIDFLNAKIKEIETKIDNKLKTL